MLMEGVASDAHTGSGSGIIMVTRNEEMRQHRVNTVLLEEKVTIAVSAQEHERNQCRLDEGVQP